ncbi:MAG: hypothetical protein JWQ35_1238 [Bacteriovoracaceae bacterium]|nr:hypothetical protein [Bacteriovoracaceae bacterium]
MPPEEVKTLSSQERCSFILEILSNPHTAMAEVFKSGVKNNTVLQALIKLYPELRWLTYKTDASPEAEGVVRNGSPSLQVFGAKYDEFDRSIVGITTMQQVLLGDYEGFITPQNPKIALSRASFEDMRKFLQVVVPNDEAMDAMLAFMSIHDLGKVKSFVRLVKGITLQIDADHDKVLVQGLHEEPIIAPSFIRLSDHYRKLILDGLAADFNMGQFVQGENVAASVKGLIKLNGEAMNFYLAHVLYDIAGAAGGAFPVGSKIMTEPVYAGFKDGVKALQVLPDGQSPENVYKQNLNSRLQPFLPKFDPNKSEDYALGRLALMSRFTGAEDLKIIAGTLSGLPESTEKLLVEGLNATGIGNWAVLPYYAPALIENLKIGLADKTDHPRQKSILLAMRILAQVYAQAKRAFINYHGEGVLTVDLNQMATLAKKNPAALETGKIVLKFEGKEKAIAQFENTTSIDLTEFPKINHIGEAIPGKRILPIGVGGGSDIMQAVQLGLMARRSGKEVPAVISFRTAKPESQGGDGKTAPERKLENHGGEIYPGVFRVLSTTTGTGRFLENIPADEIKVYQITLDSTRSVQDQMNAVLKDVGSIDTLVAVDTGGDSLYPITHESTNEGRATPDQDLFVLKELALGKTPVISAVIAPGIDSPENASQILKAANARFYKPDKSEQSEIEGKYNSWDFTGENPARFGKTAFAWQKALSGYRGVIPINLPVQIVLDPKNPWDPFVNLQDATAGIMFMNLHDHLKAIGAR